MDSKAKSILDELLSLDKAQQAEIGKEIRGRPGLKPLTEEVRKGEIGMGPVGGVCPRCGR
jgi:hypothetical protein